jgi:leucyl-tRNA synthetase
MKTQLKSPGLRHRLGARARHLHPEYYRWEQWLFTRLLEKGLIYTEDPAR